MEQKNYRDHDGNIRPIYEIQCSCGLKFLSLDMLSDKCFNCEIFEEDDND